MMLVMFRPLKLVIEVLRERRNMRTKKQDIYISLGLLPAKPMF